MNFIQEFDGKRLPVDCIDHFNSLADMLSVRDAGKIKGILDNLESEAERTRRMNEIMEAKKLPVINVDVILKKQEEAYFDTQVIFYEERTKRIYQGGSAGTSIRVARGVSFRIGANKGNAVSEDYMKQIDTGEFIITNKRIVFVGENKRLEYTPHQINENTGNNNRRSSRPVVFPPKRQARKSLSHSAVKMKALRQKQF